MRTCCFLQKNFWQRVGVIALCIFSLGVCLYGYYLNASLRFFVGVDFFYVVSTNANVSVGAYDAQRDGGAGYLLENDEGTMVAYAVYFSREDGERALGSVQVGDKTAMLTTRSVSNLYMKSFEDKKNAQLFVGALTSYLGCMQVLFQEIERLDKGCTQESARKMLHLLERQLNYLSISHVESYPQFSSVCAWLSKDISTYQNEIVYANDLRWILCKMSEDYLSLTNEFAL